MNKKEVQSKVNVPFSWENKQGVSNYKVKHTNLDYDIQFTPTKPLPLSKNTKDLDCDGLKIPPPPCFYERPAPRLRSSSSRRGLKKKDEDDPFYIAYKECTKTSSSIGMKKKKNKNYMSSAFSCKSSCSVREDSVVMINLSHIPISRSVREKRGIQSPHIKLEK